MQVPEATTELGIDIIKVDRIRASLCPRAESSAAMVSNRRAWLSSGMNV